MFVQYAVVDATATTTPQSKEVNARGIVWIFNDSDTNKLYVSFAGDNADYYIPILPNEKIYRFPQGIDVGTLWYKSNVGETPFRLLGNKNC